MEGVFMSNYFVFFPPNFNNVVKLIGITFMIYLSKYNSLMYPQF